MKVRLVWREFAEAEATWFFRDLGGKVPDSGDVSVRDAAAQIDAWLRQLPTFHRGVLSLRHTPRAWPTFVTDEFGALASVAVRLECALQPAVGVSNEVLENASVERLREAIRLCERVRARRTPSGRDKLTCASERRLDQLESRAARHVDLAHSALARVRGYGLCVVPPRGSR